MSCREHYAKKGAYQMYFQGLSTEKVREMLLTEGAGDQAEALAAKYFEDYQLIRSHQKQQNHKKGSIYLTVGWVFIAGSILYGLLTYIAFGNGNFISLTGLMVVGIITVIKGTRDKQAG